MHIEIRDPSLVERLRVLLPRPDSTYDEAIKTLLERPCKPKAREIAEEVVERLLGDDRIQAGRPTIDEKRLYAVMEEAVAKAIESKIAEGLRNAIEEAKKAPVDVEAISERAAVKAVRLAFKSGGFKYTLNRVIGEAMIELVEQIKGILAEQVKWALIEPIIAEQVKKTLTEHMPEIIKAIEEARMGGWEVVIQQALKRPDRCLTFREIKQLYGKELNIMILRRHGFVRKKKGIWCYTGEQKSEEQQNQ